MAQTISLKVLLTLLFTVFLQFATAIPVRETSLVLANATETLHVDTSDLLKRYVGAPRGKVGDGGPASSDYPSDDDIRAAFVNTQGPYVFYSGIGSDTTKPYAFSNEVGGVILRNALPKKYLNQGSRSAEWLGDFWDRASGIFAELAPNNVYFVSNWPDGNVEACSIWARMERPTLEANGKVNTITLIDWQDFDNRKQIYSRSTKRHDTVNTLLLEKRDAACDGADIVDGPDA